MGYVHGLHIVALDRETSTATRRPDIIHPPPLRSRKPTSQKANSWPTIAIPPMPPPPPYMVIQVDTAISSWRLVVQTIKCGKGPGPANGTDYSNMTAQSKVYAC